MQEIRGIIQIIARIDEWLTNRIFIGHCGNGRDFGNQTAAGDAALFFIVNISAVMIESRQRADHADHNGHRVRIAAETVEKTVHLFMQHGVLGNGCFKLFEFFGIRQFAVQQQIASFNKAAFIGQLFNRIPTVQQCAFFAIDKGDGRFAAAVEVNPGHK